MEPSFLILRYILLRFNTLWEMEPLVAKHLSKTLPSFNTLWEMEPCRCGRGSLGCVSFQYPMGNGTTPQRMKTSSLTSFNTLWEMEPRDLYENRRELFVSIPYGKWNHNNTVQNWFKDAFQYPMGNGTVSVTLFESWNVRFNTLWEMEPCSLPNWEVF